MRQFLRDASFSLVLNCPVENHISGYCTCICYKYHSLLLRHNFNILLQKLIGVFSNGTYIQFPIVSQTQETWFFCLYISKNHSYKIIHFRCRPFRYLVNISSHLRHYLKIHFHRPSDPACGSLARKFEPWYLQEHVSP